MLESSTANEIAAFLPKLKGPWPIRMELAEFYAARRQAARRVSEYELLERAVRDRGEAGRGDAIHGWRRNQSKEVERLNLWISALEQRLKKAS